MKRASWFQIGTGALAVSAIAGVVLVAQSPVTTIPGPAVVTGSLTITDGRALIGTEMNSFPMAAFVSSSDDPDGRKGRIHVYRATAAISSNLQYDPGQGRWVADNAADPAVIASTQGDHFEVWHLLPGAADLTQAFGVYAGGVGMYTRQPHMPVDINGDVHITGNLYLNGVQVKPFLYGGDNELYKEFDLDWYGGCDDEYDDGNVYLTDRSFQLYGPGIGSGLSFQNAPGVVYDDGSVRIENVRKTDHDELAVAKYNDHVHYRVHLHACTGDGGAHRYIRIHVHGRKAA